MAGIWSLLKASGASAASGNVAAGPTSEDTRTAADSTSRISRESSERPAATSSGSNGSSKSSRSLSRILGTMPTSTPTQRQSADVQDSHSNHAHSRSHSQATINQTAPQQRPPPISSGLSGFLGSAQIGRRKHSTRPSKSSDITITPLSHSDQENNSASKTENGVENAVGDAFGPPFTTSGLQGDSSSSANTPSRGGKPSSQVDVVANATPATPAAARSSIVTSTSTVTGVAIDPLSQQIYLRKSTELSTGIPHRLSQMAEGIARASSELSHNVVSTVDLSKERRYAYGDVTRQLYKSGRSPSPNVSSRRGGSLLSRLSIRGRKNREIADVDSESDFGSETRLDGTNARVFSQTSLNSPIVGGGYIPHHKEPPRYIRVKTINKKTREFNRMFLAQELVGTYPVENNNGEPVIIDGKKAPTVSISVPGSGDRKTMRTGGAIWASQFNKDGKYLATGGRDCAVRIWAVISSPEERRKHEESEGERLSAPVFQEKPIKEFRGHTGEVLALSWSKNNFLLSSSMDKTVRLWHPSRPECLAVFQHKDFVTKLAFHPRDDRFFLAGSLDTMLRLWSIPDKDVAYSVKLPDLVTACAFSPDGKIAIAGLLNGLCVFYETEGLKKIAELQVRSTRGKNAKGSKITGIQTMVIPPPSVLPDHASTVTDLTEVGYSDVKVLITSNDSRIRVYNLATKTLEVKFRGHVNSYSQISASFSDDGKYVICGSEDRKTFIWSMTPGDAVVQPEKDRDKLHPCEFFEAHSEIVTTALFAPTKTRMLLGNSGDPIYDLCNPPPVVLQSLEDMEAISAAASQVALSAAAADLPIDQQTPTTPSIAKRPEPSPAYIARSTHYDGNIIVTTSDTGIIKVFRQDCAFTKRRHESWETGSAFSRKLASYGSSNGGYVGNGGLGRSISVLTRTSENTHSRSGSLSQVLSAGAVETQPDRILSWRQGVEPIDKRLSQLRNGTGSEGGQSPVKGNGSSLPTPLPPQTNNGNLTRSSTLPVIASARPNSNGGVSTSAATAPNSPASPVDTSFNATVTTLSPAPVPGRMQRTLSQLTSKTKDSSKSRKKMKIRDQEEQTGPPTPSFTFHPANPSSANGGLAGEDDELMNHAEFGVASAMTNNVGQNSGSGSGSWLGSLSRLREFVGIPGFTRTASAVQPPASSQLPQSPQSPALPGSAPVAESEGVGAASAA